MKKLIMCALCLATAMLVQEADAQVGARPVAPVTPKHPSDPRVEKLLKDADLKYTVDTDGDFRLGTTLENGRTQIAWVLSETDRLFETMEIRKVWSIAYRSPTPFGPDIANRLLEQNGNVKLGAWQVRKMGNDYVAVFEAQIAADTDVLSLLLALHAVTSTADEMEKELSQKDEF